MKTKLTKQLLQKLKYKFFQQRKPYHYEIQDFIDYIAERVYVIECPEEFDEMVALLEIGIDDSDGWSSFNMKRAEELVKKYKEFR